MNANNFRASIVSLAVIAGVAAAARQTPVVQRVAATPTRFKAVAFDYLVLFDPDSIFPEVERAFPGRARELTALWRTRQFEYSWLRSITDRYVDFSAVTDDALTYTARALKVELTADKKQRLLDAHLHLTPWPDTLDTLRRLRRAGVRVIALSNFNQTMLQSNAEHAGLIALIDELVSTDLNHTFKPDPRAYQLAIDHLHLSKEDVLFAAFGAWDAAGARAFGYPTIWVNRLNQPVEELGVRPDWTVTNLSGLLDLVLHEPPAPSAKSPAPSAKP